MLEEPWGGGGIENGGISLCVSSSSARWCSNCYQISSPEDPER